MIKIDREDRCCGCYACINSCPKQCIRMVENEDGFRYPEVDESRCVNCGLCEMSCPYLNLNVKSDILKSPEAYTIRSKSDETLLSSASGGIFYELAKVVISKGGIVFGAVWGDKYNVVYHKSARTLEEVKAMQGSKYLQSDIGLCYKEAKELLTRGKLVLFSGTPCQIAGLLTYLRKDYENLITCDLICHGVPSPMVLRTYLEESVGKDFESKILYYRRQKDLGWKPVRFAVEFKDGMRKVIEPSENKYNILFSKLNAQHRYSCYCCRFARSPRVADITLGDYFVYKNAIDKDGNEVVVNDNKGMSLITINTIQGRTFFKFLENQTDFTNLKVYSVKSYHLFQGPDHSPYRHFLFMYLRKGLTVSEAYDLLQGKMGKLKKMYYRILFRFVKK